MLRNLYETVLDTTLGILERRGIARQDAVRDWKLIPNRISLFRIGLAPLPALLLIFGSNDLFARWSAVVIFVLLIATDGIDGYLARKYNWTSELGRVLDPIGDKLLIVLTLVGMLWVYWDYELGVWFCVFVWVAIAREVILTAQIRLAQDAVTSPTLLGKAKTAVQAVAIGIWLVPLSWVNWWETAMLASLGIALAITVVSWWEYDLLFVRDHRRKLRAAKHR